MQHEAVVFERPFSRRELIRRGALSAGALTVGAVTAGGLLDPNAALAGAGHAPRPIPGGLDHTFKPVPTNPFIHVLAPGIGFEMATITDFKGIVAGSEIRGTASGSDGTTYDFDTDMRFMHGVYRSLGGKLRHGSFGFV